MRTMNTLNEVLGDKHKNKTHSYFTPSDPQIDTPLQPSMIWDSKRRQIKPVDGLIWFNIFHIMYIYIISISIYVYITHIKETTLKG